MLGFYMVVGGLKSNMCVIIHKPKFVTIEDSILKQCWIHNFHGAGFMYADNDKLTVSKGFMKYDHFLEEYKKIDPDNKELVIHFRLASSGKISPECCHPFLVNDDLAFVHNGIFPYSIPPDYPYSDTQIFCNKILKQLPRNFLNNKGICELINVYIQSSILVFLDNKGKIIKFDNIDYDKERYGCWFSNFYWEVKEEDPMEEDQAQVANILEMEQREELD